MIKRIFLVFGCLLVFSPAYALSCGAGKILAIDEGGWNTNDFYIRIDYSVSQSSHPGTEFSGLIVYRKANLDPVRFKGIKSIALAAYFAGKNIRAWSGTNNCSDATEILLGKLSG